MPAAWHDHIWVRIKMTGIIDHFFKRAITCIILFLLSLPGLFAQSPVPDTAQAVLIADGFSLSEGPYWHPDGYLLFSDVSRSIIYKWSPDEGGHPYLRSSGGANGIAADRFGNLLTAQQGDRNVVQIDTISKTLTPIATNYRGARFHSPNDLVVKSDGAVFFTDPPWGGHPPEMNFHGVYRIPPGGGAVQLLVDTLSYPNGIGFSPDESKLYVTETNNSHINVFDVVDDSTLANGRVFAVVNQYGKGGQSGADGMKVDNAGNVWATGSEGVAVFSPDGELLDIINVPGSTTNVGFGGTDRLTLFITNFTGLYQVDLGPLNRLEAPANLQASRTDSSISLSWEGSGESAKYVSVYRSINNGAYKKIIATPYNHGVTDTDVSPTDSYTYKVTVTDMMGFESDFSDEVTSKATSLDERGSTIPQYELRQNYPNPFNPSTNISFSLAQGGPVALKIYNVKGQLVDTILDKKMSSGQHRVKWDGSPFSSGFYVYTLEAGNMRYARKLLLIK